TSSVETTTAATTGSGTIQVGAGDAVTVGLSVAGSAAGQSVGSAFAKAEAINSASIGGLTATAVNTVELTAAATTGTSTGDAYSLTINGQVIFAALDQETNGVLTAQDIADGVNSQSSNTGVTAVLNGADLQLTAADGRDIAIGQTLGGAAGGGLSAGTGTTVAVNGGTVSLTATENVAITGDGTVLGFATANFTIAKDTTTLNSVSVTSVANSNDAISRIDSALKSVSDLRSTFGALQNRFESTVNNLSTTSVNLSAARSRILDADFAAETANLTRGQILQQAGTAILSQANALPQNVLSLLG
ncbi:UNVERIFIED_CONTAM: hypothetical protein GTU68_051107, partial [Idotea baltica]|nr:hypothetical protein [Idotea baltica]